MSFEPPPADFRSRWATRLIGGEDNYSRWLFRRPNRCFCAIGVGLDLLTTLYPATYRWSPVKDSSSGSQCYAFRGPTPPLPRLGAICDAHAVAPVLGLNPHEAAVIEALSDELGLRSWPILARMLAGEIPIEHNDWAVAAL